MEFIPLLVEKAANHHIGEAFYEINVLKPLKEMQIPSEEKR